MDNSLKKKQIKFKDDLQNINSSNINQREDTQYQQQSLTKQKTNSMSEEQSPFKRSKSILQRRPSIMTEQEILEEKNNIITRNNQIRHSDKNESQIQVEEICTMGVSDTKIFCIKFDSEDKYIAAACENGEIRVYNTKNEQLIYTLANESHSSFSYLKWRPVNGYNKTKNVFVTTNADGQIQHWHLNSGKCIDTIQVHGELDSQLYCLDFNHDATKFVVSGAEPILRLYDEQKKMEILQLGNKDNSTISGHNNRVFCCKFSKEDPNIILSGGWDEKVLIWDIREQKPVKYFHGPKICGDSIDMHKNLIITASWSDTNQLQEWNMSTCKLIENIPWESNSADPTLLYCCQFSKKEGSLILCGGSYVNEARLFDTELNNNNFATIYGLPREVDTVDFGNNHTHSQKQGTTFAISGGDGLIRMFRLNIVA